MFVFYVCESVSVFYVDSSVLFLRILCLSYVKDSMFKLSYGIYLSLLLPLV